jgi:16S rRNA (cytosine967-C5)-methyltransferase
VAIFSVPRLSPREIAADLILRIDAGRLSTQDLFHSRDLAQLPDNDRALAYELILGVVRWRLTLDWLIEKSSGRRLQNLSPALIAILRISIFQLRFLTRVPEYAAVNEAVDLARHAGSKAAGFVNAVLRGYLRTKPQPPSGDGAAEQAIRTSHPVWLLRRWRSRFGVERTEEMALKNNEHSQRAVRWNVRRSSIPNSIRGKSTFRDCRTLRNCFYAESLSDEFKEGEDYFRQDEASQMAAFIPPAHPAPASAVDVCAAPGGKAFITVERFPDTVTILADSSVARLASTRERAGRLGLETLRYVACDAAVPQPFRRQFDLVFVDAPCSGLGTIRRNPEIKWRVSESSLRRQQRRQKEILDQSARQVSPGGHLVYTTCSTEPEENEEVVTPFLERNHLFQLQPIRSPELQPFVDDRIYSTMDCYPDIDGFFGFLMQRQS